MVIKWSLSVFLGVAMETLHLVMLALETERGNGNPVRFALVRMPTAVCTRMPSLSLLPFSCLHLFSLFCLCLSRYPSLCASICN